MAKKKTQTIEREESLVDVSTDETHYIVQCEDVRLITSNLKPLVVEESSKQKSRFRNILSVSLRGNIATPSASYGCSRDATRGKVPETR